MVRFKRKKRLRRAISEREALRLLREVPAEHVFRFYTALGEATGLAARSVQEFLEKLQSLDIRSVEFHVRRGDFENWLRFLGDERLAARVARIGRRRLSGEELRRELYEAISRRVKHLNRVERILGRRARALITR